MSKRYFINNFDTFFGKALISELFKEEIEDPTLMATYKDITKTEKPKGFKKILKREKPKLSRKKMLEECDVYVYDLHSSDSADINFVVDSLKNASIEENKVLILVSNVLVWANTPLKEKVIVKTEEAPLETENKDEPIDKEDFLQKDEKIEENQQGLTGELQEGEGLEEKQIENAPIIEIPKEYLAFQEEDYKERIPHPNYQKFKELEDLALSLQKENLKVVVICSGILYGKGEILFHRFLQAAWLQEPVQLPYLSEGSNKLPMIHITDLAKFIIKIAESPPESNYVLALDNAKIKTQKDIIEAISKGIGSGQVVSVENHEIISAEDEEILKINLDMIPSKLLIDEENPTDFEWTCQNGIAENTNKVLQEFAENMKLRPLKTVLFCDPKDETTMNLELVAKIISKHYRIPIIFIDDIINAVDNLQDDLGLDFKEELTAIKQYLNEKNDNPKLSEATKVLFRAVKWRLSQNDCKNRGYILINYPYGFEDAKHIFNKCKLKRKKKKPIKNVQKNLEIDENGLEKDPEDPLDAEELQKETDPQEEELKEEEEEEKEEEEEEENAENHEEGEDADNPQRNEEGFFPESVIFLRRLEKKMMTHSSFAQNVWRFFDDKHMEIFLYDAFQKDQFDIFESMKIYIEREGTPFNYLESEEELKRRHFEYYEQMNNEIVKDKDQKTTNENNKTGDIRFLREKNAKEQFDYVKDNEINYEGNVTYHFREYLMEFVVPQLTSGLLEVTQMRPEDPVEFLSEFIFKKSFEL